MKKAIAGLATSALLGFSLFAAVPAQADHLPPNISCSQVLVTPEIPGTPAIPAVPAVEEVSHFVKGELITPAVEASPAQWWVWAPNKVQEPFVGPPSFPNDERGTWQGPKTNGGPDQEETGTFQNGSGDGSWFHRTPAVEAQDAVYGPDVKVIDVEAVPGVAAVPAVPAIPAVTTDECITEAPVDHTVSETPVAVVPVPTCADLGVTNILAGTEKYFAQNDSDKDGVACEQVSTSPKSDVPAVVDQSQTSTTVPAEQQELAKTGAEDLILPAGIAILALLAGGGLVLANRRTA